MRRTTAQLLDLNYYQMLEVDQGATEEQIRQAYHRQALLYHPDKIKLSLAENAVYRNAMYLINEACDVLRNKDFPNSREVYDYALREGNSRATYSVYRRAAAHHFLQSQEGIHFFSTSTVPSNSETAKTNSKKLQEKGYSNISPGIPAEFFCELTYEVMDDPVRLPMTNQICDRSSIEKALRIKSENPFNRAP